MVAIRRERAGAEAAAALALAKALEQNKGQLAAPVRGPSLP